MNVKVEKTENNNEVKLELSSKAMSRNYELINLCPKSLFDDYTKKFIRLDTVKFYFDRIYRNEINKEYSKYIKDNYSDLYVKAIKYYGKTSLFDLWIINSSYELY